ncbi:hypothetical protein JOQ06_000299, partial [Pogonophryne albipinna]
ELYDTAAHGHAALWKFPGCNQYYPSCNTRSTQDSITAQERMNYHRSFEVVGSLTTGSVTAARAVSCLTRATGRAFSLPAQMKRYP